MGNEQSMSVRIANETEIPLVYVLSMLGPLYWGVLQPGENVSRKTGRVWLTVTCYPYTGNNEPTTSQAVWGVLIPTVAIPLMVAPFVLAAMSAIPAAAPALAALGPVGALLGTRAPIASLIKGHEALRVAAAAGVAYGVYTKACDLHQTFVDAVRRATEKVQIFGHYANGDLLHVRGGIKGCQPYWEWEPMRIER